MSIPRFITKSVSRLSLRTILVVPFVLQILGTVGLVGYFSFRNGQETVNDLASQIRHELTNRIEEKLRIYTETPNVINRLNASAFAQGNIDVDNAQGEDKFWQQINIFSSTSLIYCGSELNGSVFGVGRLAGKNSLRIWESNPSTGNIPQFYRLNSKGNRTQLARKDTRKFDSRQRPWYKAAEEAGRATWSEVYLDFTTQLPTVTASIPIYNTLDRSLKGVCATDLFLPQEMSQFLRSLKIGKTGSAFIMERSGLLVSTSTNEPMTADLDSNAKRLPAIKSGNTTVRSTANYLRDRFGNFRTIQAPEQLNFSIDGQRQFVQVLPFKDRYGLDWLIVIVIPEADFMERIHVNTRTTILLCIASSLVGVAICILTARWITRPLVNLSQSAKALARGEWGQTVEISRSGDLGELATSFNRMAQKLQISFAEMKDLNESLSKSKSQLKQFLEAVPVGISVHDATGKIYFSNHTAKVLFGIEKNPDATIDRLSSVYQVYQAGTDRLYPTEQLPIVRSLKGERVKADDLELHQSDRIIPLEVISTPIFDEAQRIVYAIAAFTDITERQQAKRLLEDYNQMLERQVAERTLELEQEIIERKKAEEAAQAASLAKSAFLAHMSHELRTPLNIILGFTQVMILKGSLTPQQQENLETITRSGKHLLTLINDVLEMSKIEAGKVTLNENNFDFHGLLNSLKQMFKPKAESKGLKLIFALADNLPQCIHTDETKLRQVLVNLLENAIKFTIKGSVTLKVRKQVVGAQGLRPQSRESGGSNENSHTLHPTPLHPHTLVVEIEDTGTGIAVEEIKNLFDPFVQTQSGSNFQGGTGLGLAIAQKFVCLMGGEISVNSQVGVGTTFHFELPIQIVRAELLEQLNIRYAYDSPQASNDDIDSLSTSQEQLSMSLEEMTECLAQMPVEWVKQLHQAATQVNGRQIETLSEKISQSNPRLANMIVELVNNFCFEEIVIVTQQSFD
jgi:PAS domain S-box-containing protein